MYLVIDTELHGTYLEMKWQNFIQRQNELEFRSFSVDNILGFIKSSIETF